MVPDRMANIQMSARDWTEDKIVAAIPNDLQWIRNGDKIPYIVKAFLSSYQVTLHLLA